MTTDTTSIEQALANITGLDNDTITQAMETHIERIESIDGKKLNRDKLSTQDALFIMDSVVSAQNAGDFK